MFEAVIMLCAILEEDAEVCRAALVPGHEAETLAGCTASLETARLKAAGCQRVGEVLTVTEVAPGVFVHTGKIAEANRSNRGDISNFGFVVGQQSVAVIDSGGAAWLGEALWRSIRATTDLPVSHVILTHMHPDHIFGASVLEQSGATVVGHTRLARAIADRQANYLQSLAELIGPMSLLGTTAPEVTLEVDGQLEIDLGHRVITLQSWPTAHSGNDLTVFDTFTGTLFAGDLVFDRHLPALDGSLRGWQAVLAELSERPVAQVVPGHGAATVPWPDGGTPVQRYLNVLSRDTTAAIQSGQRLGEAVDHIAAEEAPNWELFDAFNPRNATVAYTEMEWD